MDKATWSGRSVQSVQKVVWKTSGWWSDPPLNDIKTNKPNKTKIPGDNRKNLGYDLVK